MTSAKHEIERELAGTIIQLMRELKASQTGLYNLWVGRMTNTILQTATRIFPATGVLALEFRGPIGCITVDYQGAAGTACTVVAGGADTAAPMEGTGVYVVQAGTCRNIAITGRQITLYGTHDTTVCYTAYADGPHPTSV